NALGTSRGYTHQCWHEWHTAQSTTQPLNHSTTQPLNQPAIPDALSGWRTVIDANDPSQAADLDAIRAAVAAGKISVG
ncbi:MAG TPA: hypothetical protein PL105_24995, partial [Caldilineaceae bacterium]|nr:hypothetical protein [Caldilineaceae bacterium]